MSNDETHDSKSYKTYAPSVVDEKYMKLARQYRVRMKAPEQSSFRVVSIITFRVCCPTNPSTFLHNGALQHIFGCNIEATPIRASVCGERCALFNLVAQYPAQNFQIDTVYILTDADEPKCSGLLCLEFMSSFGLKSTADIKIVSFAPDATGGALVGHLCDLYPFPSVYKYIAAQRASHALYTKMRDRILSTSQQAYVMKHEWPMQWRQLYQQCMQWHAHSMPEDDKLYHPLSFVGGVLFEDGSMECSPMFKALEYGASVECVVLLLHKMETQQKLGNKALLLMIVDDYGVLHAPNAVERTALVEKGFKDVCCVIHYHQDKNPIFFYQFDDDFNTVRMPQKFAIFVKSVAEIVPAPPNKDMLKGFADDSHKKAKL